MITSTRTWMVRCNGASQWCHHSHIIIDDCHPFILIDWFSLVRLSTVQTNNTYQHIAIANMAEEAYSRAMELAVEDQYEEAARYYDEAIEKNPRNASYYLARAQNHIKLKNWIGTLNIYKHKHTCMHHLYR